MFVLRSSLFMAFCAVNSDKARRSHSARMGRLYIQMGLAKEEYFYPNKTFRLTNPAYSPSQTPQEEPPDAHHCPGPG